MVSCWVCHIKIHEQWQSMNTLSPQLLWPVRRWSHDISESPTMFVRWGAKLVIDLGRRARWVDTSVEDSSDSEQVCVQYDEQCEARMNKSRAKNCGGMMDHGSASVSINLPIHRPNRPKISGPSPDAFQLFGDTIASSVHTTGEGHGWAERPHAAVLMVSARCINGINPRNLAEMIHLDVLSMVWWLEKQIYLASSWGVASEQPIK
jgi:hypothetical protein